MTSVRRLAGRSVISRATSRSLMFMRWEALTEREPQYHPGGNFYATYIFTNGWTSGSPVGALVQVAKNGHRSIWGAGQLFAPSGFASRGDDVYVSNWSVMPAKNRGGPTGQIIKFDIN
jgi:hypothetical protein